MSTYIIYKTTNLVNGKIYVGQHNTSVDDGYLGSGSKLLIAIKEFGKENFIRETIEYCPSTNINEKEVYWIDTLSARNPEIGYNLMIGGCVFPILFGEDNPSFGKGDLFRGSKNHFYGQHHSDESKKKIGNRLYLKGKDHPNFGKSTIEIFNGKPGSFKGKHHSKESIEKIRKSNSGRKHSDKTKQKCKEINLGENNPNSKYKYIINGEIFYSLTLLCEKYNFNLDGLQTSLKLRKGRYKGWQIEKKML